MLDLETLSSESNAVIISIGAVFFDMTGVSGTGREYYRVLKTDVQQARGARVSQDTLAWWAKQSEEARAVFDAPNKLEADDALDEFAEWIGPNRYVWGNGADFDNVILGNLYKLYGKKAPWSYGGNRCFRTIKNIVTRDKGSRLPDRTGTHHNALDDAKYQALCCIEFMKGTLRLER